MIGPLPLHMSPAYQNCAFVSILILGLLYCVHMLF
jgi:hypothetical protein